MAHLPPNTAIFSPSVARAAASAAKDWSYIDRWLQRKFPGRGPPPFERNADTLRALLALAAANQAADEERALIARLEAETLDQLRAYEKSRHQNQTGGSADAGSDTNDHVLHDAREAILTALESSLTREGQTALNAMATLALQTGVPQPTPTALGAELINLSAQSATLEQTISRIDTLTAYLSREAAATAELSAELGSPSPHHHHHDVDNDPTEDGDDNGPAAPQTGYHPPANLAIQNLETQRRIKALSARLPELRDKAASLAKSVGSGSGSGGGVPSSSSSSSSPPLPPPSSSPSSSWSLPFPSIEQVRQEEEAYLALLAQKKALDAQVRAFAGLPPDTERARQELEGLRAELRRMTLRRDEVFEGLVERETPRKGPPARR
ncbi:cb850af5-d71f-4b9d-bf11-1054d8deacb4 [Thermothielavioides terrestris]|jgi:HAUS augmin-like complex subunit 1|uniref:Uncharacterized protein n=2 Tax=Thermothielavioides terrestris TaxID=2587410 RepID=G2R6Z9_THETT|nr:uncharacterized protein THITE_2116685 [Thermothielavioides terrestris NRRL 8126]AEO67727.1 hypothetical protein THITE_2116685 [Thermothielavioides terrestris NRRL 8126]SPQ25853.1 cb850af5-d71f-4b9d-bf11-1054d8deacb4 [Thermothielavioides terrestris]